MKPGTYDQAHETQSLGTGFPITIDLATDLSIEAFSRTASRPMVGGGVADSSVDGLFEVLATSGTDVLGIRFRDLHFVSENTANENAPSAIHVESRNGNVVAATIDSCRIDRSEMNDPAGGGHPSIKAIAGRLPSAESGDASLELNVVACTIVPNVSGGVVVDLGTDCVNLPAFIHLSIQNTTFTLAGSEGTTAAVDFVLEGYDPAVSGPLHGDLACTIISNVIDSRIASGSQARFNKGIALGGDVRFDGSVGMGHTDIKIQDNEIYGCVNSGIYFVSKIDDPLSLGGVNIQSWFIDNNLISDNLGDGILLEGGDGQNETPYMRVYIRGNLIVDNGGSGVVVRDVGDQSGNLHLLNCTIASNARYGIEVVDSYKPWLEYVQNSVVWDNALGSSAGWDPCLDAQSTTGFQYNDWDGTGTCIKTGCDPDPLYNYNINVDPLFVNTGSGDFHLSTGSCCIDNGTNTPASTSSNGFLTDIDGQRRRTDGDNDDIVVIDIGADEVP